MDNIIPIACSANSSYLPHLSTMLTSLVNNNKDVLFDCFLFINKKEINTSIIEKLSNSFNSKAIRFTIINISSEDFYDFKVSSYISIESYFRFLIPKKLPLEYKKALYLDADMVINGSLSELFRTNIENYDLAAVEDLDIDENVKQKLGVDCYFNAGLLLLNLEKIRNEKLDDEWFNIAIDKQSIITYNDQCVLNYVSNHKWKKLHPKWNLMTYNTIQKDKSLEVLEALAQPIIIHFNEGLGRPWETICFHPYKYFYEFYRSKSVFSNYKKKKGRKKYIIKNILLSLKALSE